MRPHNANSIGRDRGTTDGMLIDRLYEAADRVLDVSQEHRADIEQLVNEGMELIGDDKMKIHSNPSNGYRTQMQYDTMEAVKVLLAQIYAFETTSHRNGHSRGRRTYR